MSSGDDRSPEPPTSKPALRRWLKRRRDAVAPADRRRWSDSAAQNAIDSGLLDEVDLLGVYAPLGAEADPARLFRWHLGRGRALAFPRVTPAGLRWHVARPETLAPAPPWSILEPDPDRDPEVHLSTIDGWVVPGLGFTEDGWRLGYGRGFYDRVLVGVRGRPVIGFGFALQIMPTLPCEAHDQRLSAVVTEARVCVASSNQR